MMVLQKPAEYRDTPSYKKITESLGRDGTTWKMDSNKENHLPR
jgi:hypothetical protein